MRPSHEARIETLRSRRAQIDAEILRLHARDKTQIRKDETRRKILIGALIINEMEGRQDFNDWVHSLLARKLSKPRDRALFGIETPAAE